MTEIVFKLIRVYANQNERNKPWNKILARFKTTLYRKPSYAAVPLRVQTLCVEEQDFVLIVSVLGHQLTHKYLVRRVQVCIQNTQFTEIPSKKDLSSSDLFCMYF